MRNFEKGGLVSGMNPFIYGEEVEGENFCNRLEEIKALASEIESFQKGKAKEKGQSKNLLTAYPVRSVETPFCSWYPDLFNPIIVYVVFFKYCL
jgi:hypothetical protein